MSLQLLLAVTLLAVLFFWATGAHSRLVTLRNAVNQAGARLAEGLVQRHSALTQLRLALLQPLAAEAGALQALAAAQTDEQAAASALATRALDAVAARQWLATQAPLDFCGARVLALLDQHDALRQQSVVAQPLQSWHDTQSRLALLRQAYNAAADAHNHALAQFPTRLLARPFRFAAAGRV